MASILPKVNLPTSVLAHAIGLTVLGLGLIFGSQTPYFKSESSPVLGIASMGLGLAYLSTSYMPLAENAFLHASVPVRVGLAAVSAIRALLAKEGEDTGVLWVIALYDGLGGLSLGWTLGRWDGRIARY